MKVAIMQPYFVPYIGYFQLMNAVDEFIVYDNIEYSKGGWINRNRILVNGKPSFITLPLKKGSDFLNVDERMLSDSVESFKYKTLRKIQNVYSKAPEFNNTYPIIEQIFTYKSQSLFHYLFNSLLILKKHLDISSKLIMSSTINIDAELKFDKKVISLVKEKKALTYINPIGGQDLYDKEHFLNYGIELFFLKSKDIDYKQFDNEFVPWLSIIDVLMFNSKEEVLKMLNEYELIK